MFQNGLDLIEGMLRILRELGGQDLRLQTDAQASVYNCVPNVQNGRKSRSHLALAAKVSNPPTADEGLTGRNVLKGREIAIFN